MASRALRTLRFLHGWQIERLHSRNILNSHVLQHALLESAARSPINVKHYEQTDDIFKLAAHLSERIIKNHAFIDGNKRGALLAADMFLQINGHMLQEKPFAQDTINLDLAAAQDAVCTNQWTTEDLAAFYKRNAATISQESEKIIQYLEKAIEY